MYEEANNRLTAELTKPFEAKPRHDGVIYSDDEFDPWSLFPCVYGTYALEFDQCALDVLAELRDKEKRRDDLGAEMFREMLCTADLCDYGTSPRVCFWVHGDDLLNQLIDRWAEWSERQWASEATTECR